MLIKNTNPNELLAEFKRDENFCPYNEEEVERLKKEGKRLYENTSSSIYILHNGVHFKYELSRITGKEVCYEYKEYGSIYEISPMYSKEREEYIRFDGFDEIVFFYSIKNLDGNLVWSVRARRMADRNKEVWLWFGEEVKFKKVGY